VTTTKTTEKQSKTVKVKSILKVVGGIIALVASYYTNDLVNGSPKEPQKQEQPAQPTQPVQQQKRYYSFQLVIDGVAPLTIIYDSQVMALEDHKVLTAADGTVDVQLRDLSNFLVRAEYVGKIIGITRPSEYGRQR